MNIGVVSVRKNQSGQYNRITYDFGGGMKTWAGRLKVHGEWFDTIFDSPFGMLNWMINNYGISVIKIVEVNDLEHIRFYIQAPGTFSAIEIDQSD
jgi:hypothetical protein